MKALFPLAMTSLLLGSVAAQSSTSPPLPRQKPIRNAVETIAMIPLPRPNPRRSSGVLPPAAAPSKSWPQGESGWQTQAVKEARAECARLLKGLDLGYAPLPAIGGEGGCGTPAPIELASVAGVAITPSATVNCDVAYQLHAWVTGSVQPAARAKLKTRVTEIRNAASYVCRSRNGLKGGKLSEHGRANAIDMAGFSFAKADGVTVGDGWGGILQSIGLSRGGSFLGAIRDDACTYFSTVLGPGSDRYHGNHFHVDAIRRKNGGRICK